MRKLLLAIMMMLVLAANVFAAIPTTGDPYIGESNAEIEVIQFVDFSDADDREFLYEVLVPLWSDYIDTGKVKVIVKDFPGADGFDAANAAECADDYGKFTQFYVGLFSRYSEWVGENDETQKDVFNGIAQYNGITNSGFNMCLENDAHFSEIADDKQHGLANGVYDTPTVFVNGKKLFDPNYNTLRGEIEAALDGPVPPVTYANIQITPSGRTISMEKYDSESVSYTLKNTGGKTTYVTLSTTDNSGYVKSGVNVGGFSLGPNNSRTVTLHITTGNAPNGTYRVNLHADYDGKRRTAVTTVNVNTYTPPVTNANISFSPTGRTVYMDRNDYESVSYSVRNTGGKTTYVTLSTTDNSGYVNSGLSSHGFTLGAGDSRNVTLNITTGNAPNGNYQVNLNADYDGKRRTAVTIVRVNTTPPVTNANIQFTPTGRTVYMEKYDSESVLYSVRNTGDKGTYVDLDVSDNSGYIDSRVSTHRFWLSANNSKSVTVYIETDNAHNGTYNVELEAEYDGKRRTANTRVYVDYDYPSTGSITLDATYKTVCRGEYSNVNVEVENNSNYGRNIDLWAESEMFLPYFTDDDIYLSGYNSKDVTLRFYVPSGTSTGTKYIDIYAKSGGRTYSDRARVYVRDCGNDDDDNGYDVDKEFRLTLSGSCKRIEKGEKTTFSFTLKNITNDDIRVDLQVVSDLPTELKDHVPVYLDSYERVTLEFEVRSRKTDDTGRHSITLHAWTDDYNTKESTCAYLEGTNEIDIDLVNNDLRIERGSFEVFTLLVENTGDFEEDIDIEVNDYFKGIEVTISDRHFDLDDGDSKEVYISVTATEEAELGSYELVTLVINGETYRETLRFEVTGYDADYYDPFEPDFDEPVYGDFEVISYPDEIQVTMLGDSKVEFTIGNRGEYPIYGMRVSLENLPRGIYINIPDFDIMPGETKTVEAQISVSDEVEEGTYNGKIRFASESFVDKRDIEVTVEPNEFGELTSGLFAMGANVLLGIVVLLVVIGAILLISKMVQREPSRKRREAWEED